MIAVNLFYSSQYFQDRGIFLGGKRSSPSIHLANIQYIVFGTTGSANSFCKLQEQIGNNSGTSNGANCRGLSLGGELSSAVSKSDVVYINMISTNDAKDYSSLSQTFVYGAATSNGTKNRGVNVGGRESRTLTDTDLAYDKRWFLSIGSGAVSIDTKTLGSSLQNTSLASTGVKDTAIYANGGRSTKGSTDSIFLKTIGKFTISTGSTATNVGSISQGSTGGRGLSNGTAEVMLVAGGQIGSDPNVFTNAITRITMGSVTQTSDYGDLSGKKLSLGAVSNGANNKGVFAGGTTSSGKVVNMDMVNIGTVGSVSDFGDLSFGISNFATCSMAV